MTSGAQSTVSPGRYGLPDVARMEWIKLRSLRSTWWTLGLTAAGAIGIAVAVGVNTTAAEGDLTNNVLAGVAPGLLLIGLLGVLTMTAEYTSGTIQSTFRAAPNRLLLLAAKAAVFGAVALVVGEFTSFLAFLIGRAALPAAISAPSLGEPGVLRAVALAGAGYCLIGLLGVGLGAIIRSTPAAIGALVGGVYVGAQLIGALAQSVAGYVPVSIVANSLSTVQHVPHMPSPWIGLAVLSLYALLALGAGGLLLERRDA